MLKKVLLAAGLVFASALSGHAQTAQPIANVVSSCGSTTYLAGRSAALTVDTTGVLCLNSGGTVSLVFPVTVSGTVTSGGIPCFDSTTDLKTSALLGANQVVVGGGAGVCPTSSANFISDSLGTVTTQGLTTTSPGFYAQVTGDTFPRVRIGLNASDVASISLGAGAGARDLFLERTGAANLRLGQADAASPVAQTISVQNVVAGTSNTASPDTTVQASLSTGTGIPGKFVVNIGSKSNSSASTQNAAIVGLSLLSTGTSEVTATIGNSTGILKAGVSGSSNITFGQRVSITDGGGNAVVGFNTPTTGMMLAAIQLLTWSNSTDPINGTADTFIRKRSAAVINFGSTDAASPVNQTLSTQGSRAGTDTNIGGANLTIQPGIGTGTGTPSNFVLNGIVGTTTGTGAQAASAGLTIAGVATGQKPSVVLGSAALGTTATDGFLYMATSAGPPTGVPTAFTGRVAFDYDTTNHQLWIYDGAWLQPKTPAGAATVTWQ